MEREPELHAVIRWTRYS